jgi:beta-mannosidase
VAEHPDPEIGVKYPGRPRTVAETNCTSLPLDAGWTFCSAVPGSIDNPELLDASGVNWQPAVVPGTVATTLREHAGVNFDPGLVPDVDALDWWYRCRFACELPSAGELITIRCDGLATLADVWINGTHAFTSENMFVGRSIDVTSIIDSDNDLVIRFRSVRSALGTRRPRPRWRTKLVEHQQLRWHRTTLLGRMPGWSPPVRAVGPWKPLTIERRKLFEVTGGDVYPIATELGGVVDVSLAIRSIGDVGIRSATLSVGQHRAELNALSRDGETLMTGTLMLSTVDHWWPHTHGAQPSYDARVVDDTDQGPATIHLAPIAFRRVSIDRADDGFAIEVNGTRVFCRGACWSTPDIVSLSAAEDVYRALLIMARDAGMNMLRVGGTMIYESDAFYDICDELGILVWQDFMFANMDYPTTDQDFVAGVAREAETVVARLRRHPSLAIMCGNSEVAQQAAMLGLEPATWSNAIFENLIPDRVAMSAPGVPYWTSSPSGGALPFHVDSGVAHYYGVGAYLRPLDDARRSNVRFASECLGFSNLPDQRAIDALLPNGESPVHHPRWKARVPRDQGTGWDFEDVRDHYLESLFGLDARLLRHTDIDRYLGLSRVVTGELMARTIDEWRRDRSTCCGALVWLFQDLWLGAGWGVVDATGRPKAAYYALKRAMQPVSISISDEGSNGLRVHLVNDEDTSVDGELRVSLVRDGSTIIASGTRSVSIQPRQCTDVGVDEVLGQFHDSAYSYRFGPLGHEVAIASLVRPMAPAIEAFHFLVRLPQSRTKDAVVSGHAHGISGSTVEIVLRAERLATFVSLDCGDFVPEDNYFHMGAGSERRLLARASTPNARFECVVQPLNALDAVHIGLAPGTLLPNGGDR